MFLHNGKYVEISTGTKNWLQDYLSKFGFNQIIMSNSDKFRLTNKPFGNGPIFMYGYKLPAESFSAEMVGNDKSLVINKVFEKEDNNNIISMVGATSLCVLSLCAIAVGNSK
jgi:hypothetical protein